MFNQQKVITILSLLILFFIFLSANLMAENIYIGDMVLIKIFTKEKYGPKENFYIGKYEITNKEYWQYDPDHKGDWSKPNFPVENVSWDDAVAYCKWLSSKTGKKYRLPTVSEWEYACSGGTSTQYYWGNDWYGARTTEEAIKVGWPFYSIGDAYCWTSSNSEKQVHTVGQKKPNAWGLYDMIGNVREWCSDWRENNIREGYVIRGGSWNKSGNNECSMLHFALNGDYGDSDYHSNDLGFRIVRTP
ncbi:MAG: SUMF1/EgtB/PvdO family nonheme iron enzyme [Candidatus Eremiobacterota bacterium]